ncbi:hypothetical protein [Methyloglobulus sp.]|uniref:hypothetical protein n=1 Tax=Methyloglobulus sp. TaxID=2518622 RepID=UPI003988D0EE
MTLKTRLAKLEITHSAKAEQSHEPNEETRQWLNGLVRHYNEGTPMPPTPKAQHRPLTKAQERTKEWLDKTLARLQHEHQAAG